MADRTLPAPEQLRQLLRYDSDTGKLWWRKRPEGPPQWNGRYANTQAFTAVSNTGYYCGRVFDRGYQAHRIAWAIHYGKWPIGEIDHINGDRKDNRIVNLRDIPKHENQRNMKRSIRNTSGVTGVCRLHDGRWLVTIQGQYVGGFDCIGQAIKARKQKERERGFHPNHGRAA